MSERITDARVQYLIDNSDTWWAGGISCGDADDIDTALTELLALRAEVERLRPVAALVTIIQKDTGAILADNERLRAVEQEARAHLDNIAWRSFCQGCGAFWHSKGHDPKCTRVKLQAALDANKQEPGT